MLLDRGDTFMIIATKITLPTVDVVTDALSINNVFSYDRSYKRTELHALGYAMICVMVLSWIMTIPHFLRVEKSWRQRLKGLPFMMLSSWPQYRGLRLIWLAHWTKNETKLKVEQKEVTETLSHVEAFLESIPQTHLTLMLLVLNRRVLIAESSGPGDYSGFVLFLLGFTSSVLSSSLGMARLLMNGPSKLVKKQGHLGGYAQVGFALVMVSIICVLVSKALWLAFSTSWLDPLYALVWIGVSLAPQITLALTLLMVNCGFRKTLTILTKWPSYALMPMFSIFTFSVEKIGNKNYLVCSTRWTLVNLVITMAGLTFGGLFLYFYVHVQPSLDFVSIAPPLMFIAIILYAIFLTVESCICACRCGPFVKKSGLDIETLEVVDLEQVQHDLHSQFEMKPLCTNENTVSRRNSWP